MKKVIKLIPTDRDGGRALEVSKDQSLAHGQHPQQLECTTQGSASRQRGNGEYKNTT